MLYQCFVSETGRKYGCLVDFFTTSLPTMRAYTHVHRRSLFKTGRKTGYSSITSYGKDVYCLFKLKDVQ